jgi:hypothetical protein
MPSDLAPVYLDDTRVTLQGDPRPKVAKILQAGGRPTTARVLRAGADRALSPDEVIDRTGDPAQPVHLTTRPLAGDEGVGGVGRQGGFAAAEPGKVQTPGDIVRGTETRAEPESAEESARAGRNPPAMRRFSESQSFADPVHKGGSPRVAADSEPSSPVPPGHVPDGGLRTQQSGREEGARTPRPASTTTTSRESLARVSEEE